MEAVFLKIVNMSLTASWMVLAVLLFRLIFRKAPRWIFCLLWGLVAIRLVCPISIESSLSLIPNSEPLPEEIIYTAEPEIDSGISSVDQFVNPILDKTLVTDDFSSANKTQIWSFIFSQLWILGMIVMAGYACISYWMLRWKLRTATLYSDFCLKRTGGSGFQGKEAKSTGSLDEEEISKQKEAGYQNDKSRIKQSEYAATPFVLGFFRPVIYLPYHMDENDLKYVIAHEMAHINRKDHWWKPIGYLLLLIYWFNPLMWIGYICLCRDIEAACDEKVIKEMDTEGRKAYSSALLNCSVHRKRIMACPLAFGEVGVKDRIKSVMNYRKPAFWLILLAVITSGFATVFLLTDPKSNNREVMGAEYSIKETLYAASIEEKGNYWSEKLPAGAATLYRLSADYHLSYFQSEQSDMVYVGEMEPYVLTNAELERYMPVKEQRTNTNVGKITDSYILRLEDQSFYLIFQTSNDRTYLAYGWEDLKERGDEASDDTQLERLFLLENEHTRNQIGRQLTLDDVTRLSEKGMDLTWQDFEEYSYYVTGSGLYIQVYEIDDQFSLWIGGTYPFSQENPDKKEYMEDPMYMRLRTTDSETESIDIRIDDVKTYIETHQEQPLQKAVHAAILSENMHSTYEPDKCYHSASFYLIGKEEASGTPLEGKNDGISYVTLYGIAMYQVFEIEENGRIFESVGGSHIPVAISFKVQNGTYELTEYWVPGDGADYSKDIQKKFPEDLWEKALYTSQYVMVQMQNCYKQILEQEILYEGDMIEKLLERIQSSPQTSSNPEDYISAHLADFQSLTYFGTHGLRHFYQQFEEENGAGLKGYIMARACQEIAAGYGEKNISNVELNGIQMTSGQEWYDAFKENAVRLQTQYPEEELKEKYYASWLLLDFLEGYY